MDVEFTVEVVRGEFLNQPWAENNDYVMVLGDIAEAVDPHVHVVAKIRKEVLSQLPKP
jgi:hypothetical protein